MFIYGGDKPKKSFSDIMKEIYNFWVEDFEIGKRETLHT